MHDVQFNTLPLHNMYPLPLSVLVPFEPSLSLLCLPSSFCHLLLNHLLILFHVPHREYNEWIMVKLQQVSELVTQADKLMKREVSFIEGYPLSSLLETDAFSLLKEAEVLMSSLVSCAATY